MSTSNFQWRLDGLCAIVEDAILYTLNQEAYLKRYLEDGHLSIDKSWLEQEVTAGKMQWQIEFIRRKRYVSVRRGECHKRVDSMATGIQEQSSGFY